MIMKELEKKKLDNCGFCRAALAHICKEEESQQLPAVLHEFGAVSKAIQSTPKEEDKDKPYWASSHEYDKSVDNCKASCKHKF